MRAVPVLVQSLRSWDLQLDDALALVREAETLADLPIGVHGPLDAIGTDGQTIASAVEHAAASVTSFRIDLSKFSPRLPRARVAIAGPPAGGKQSMAGLFQDGGKQLGDRDSGQRWPITAAQVEGARDEIEQAFIGRRDTAPAIDRYRHVLGAFIGDTSPQAGAAAMSLLSRGVPTQDMQAIFRGGVDAHLGLVAAAMQAGAAPADTDLHAAFFPDNYVAWHAHDALRTRYRVAEQALERGNGESFIHHPDVHDQLQAVVHELPEHWGVRPSLQHMLDGAEVSLAQIERVKALVGAFARSRLEAVGPQPIGRIDTLHDLVALDDQGRLSAFDAIGAAASTLSSPPPSYVGDSYAQFHWGFSTDEIHHAFSYLAQHDQAAAAFFMSLGADGASDLLPNFRFAHGPLEAGDLARDVSTAFGLASNHLPSEFGADTVRAGHERYGELTLSPLLPGHLFAHGTFHPDFLIDAAAATVTGPNPVFDHHFGVDPRLLVLAAVARQELGAEFVHALVDDRSLGDFVWPQTPFNESGIRADFAADQARPWLPVVSQLLMQAGRDGPASAALISIAGAGAGHLQVETANGLSVVIADNLPRYELGDGSDSPHPRLVAAAENVFAAGAGIEIELAAVSLVAHEIEAGLVSGADHWWGDLVWPAMIGHLEAAQYLAYGRIATGHDEAIHTRNAWVSNVSSGGGVALGVVGLATSGGAAIVAGVGGLAMTLLGNPFFQDDGATAAHQNDLAALRDVVASPDRAEQLVLLIALLSGAIELPGRATVEITGVDSVLADSHLGDLSDLTVSAGQAAGADIDADFRPTAVEVTNIAGETESFPIGEAGWQQRVMDALDAAGAMIKSGDDAAETRAGVVIGSIAAVGVASPRIQAFGATSGLNARNQHEDDDE